MYVLATYLISRSPLNDLANSALPHAPVIADAPRRKALRRIWRRERQ
jgi:hypothetical protein